MFRLVRTEPSPYYRMWASFFGVKSPKSLRTSTCQYAFRVDDLKSGDGYAAEEQDEFNKIRNSSFQPICGGRSVIVLQPFIKWGPLKKRDTTPELQLNESVSLINTLQDWTVVGKETVSLTSFCRVKFFGTGKLDELKQKIQNNPHCTAVFISINQLKAAQHMFLEQFFEKPVYDRYLIVMQIFREHAFTEEAKLQISLAEIPYLYSRMSHIHSESLSRIGSSAALISGTTIHTPKDTRRMILHKYESRIKDSLSKLKASRSSARQRRRYEEYPIVAVIGYTNAGKTSVVKALSGNERLVPEMHLFATLDVSFHLGRLPCNLKVYFVDTIGFISDIPTYLIEPFQVTLEDAINADVLVHVQDVSHPDWLFQRDRVTETIDKLNVDKKLFKYVIPVANKMDLLNQGEEKIIPSDMVQISCAKSTGIDELQERIEELVIQATGRIHIVIKAKTGSDEYSFLTKEAAVADVVADSKDANYSLLSVIITERTLDRFKRTFIA